MVAEISSNITTPRDLNLKFLCIRYNHGLLSWLVDDNNPARKQKLRLNYIIFSPLSVSSNYRFELTQLKRTLLEIINNK